MVAINNEQSSDTGNNDHKT